MQKLRAFGLILLIGVGLWFCQHLIEPILGLVIPGIASWLSELLALGVLVFCIYTVYTCPVRKYMLAGILAVGIFVGYSLVPGMTMRLTQSTQIGFVEYTGQDDNGRWVADIRDKNSDESVTHVARDVFTPPFYWHRSSGVIRKELRTSENTEVCYTDIGMRQEIFSWFPNVINVKPTEEC